MKCPECHDRGQVFFVGDWIDCEKCNVPEFKPATPTTCSMCLEPLLECDCAAIDEPTEPTSFENFIRPAAEALNYVVERDAAAEEKYGEYGDAEPNINCFKAGADFGYAKAQELRGEKFAHYSRHAEKHINELQATIDRLTRELVESKEREALRRCVECGNISMRSGYGTELFDENARLTAELAAYKTAKAENDERFQLEIGQLRALTEADKLEIDGLREENASYRTRLEESEAQHEQALNHYASEVASADKAVEERDRAVKGFEYLVSMLPEECTAGFVTEARRIINGQL